MNRGRSCSRCFHPRPSPRTARARAPSTCLATEPTFGDSPSQTTRRLERNRENASAWLLPRIRRANRGGTGRDATCACPATGTHGNPKIDGTSERSEKKGEREREKRERLAGRELERKIRVFEGVGEKSTVGPLVWKSRRVGTVSRFCTRNPRRCQPAGALFQDRTESGTTIALISTRMPCLRPTFVPSINSQTIFTHE